MARLFRRHPAGAGRDAALCRERSVSRCRSSNTTIPTSRPNPGLRAAGRARTADLGRCRDIAIPTACRKGSNGCIRHELAIVEKLNYARYFLTVHDIVKFARSQGHSLPGTRLGRQFGHLLLPRHHRCRARHHRLACSSASSRRSATSRPTSMSISSMRGATRSSPTSTRNTAQKRTALAASVVTYRGRSALREVAKAMGLSDDVQRRAVRLDLGLVVVRARREGGEGGRPRQDRSGGAGM